MIEIIDFCKEYNSHLSSSKKKQVFIIKNISFTVESGCITGIVGPNGSGKTTLLKAICGFHYATSGKIFISDKENNKFDIEEQCEKAMELCGYVPELSCLPPDLKVIDFLHYAAACHKLDPQTAQNRIEKLSKDFSLSDFLNNKIKILSKGQQQRVSFAQALIHDPANLILDEPISGLDPSQIISFRKYISDLSKEKAILISTHILSEVPQLCQKAFIMHQGQLFKVNNLQNIEQEFISLTEKQKTEGNK